MTVARAGQDAVFVENGEVFVAGGASSTSPLHSVHSSSVPRSPPSLNGLYPIRYP
jgi:hypothetical protein